MALGGGWYVTRSGEVKGPSKSTSSSNLDSSSSSSQKSSGLIGGDAGLRTAASRTSQSSSGSTSHSHDHPSVTHGRGLAGATGRKTSVRSSASSSSSSSSSASAKRSSSDLNFEVRKSGHGGGAGSSLSKSSASDLNFETRKSGHGGGPGSSHDTSYEAQKRQLERKIVEEIRKGTPIEEIERKYGVKVEERRVEVNVPPPGEEIQRVREPTDLDGALAREVHENRKQDLIESAIETLEQKKLDLMVEQEKIRQKESPVERFVGGLSLAAQGFGIGVAETLLSVPIAARLIAENPVEGTKQVVTGTVEWFKSLPGRIWHGITGNPLEAGLVSGEIAGGFLIGKGTGTVAKPIPKPAFAKLSILAGELAEESGVVRYGLTFHSMERPLITITRSEGRFPIRISRGPAPAPADVISGKTITAYSKLETAFFKETIKAHAESPEFVTFFEKGYEIANRVYKTNEPVFKPKSFEILSKNIPEEAKPIVKEVIKKERGIEVYGSTVQKLQMGEWMTREPKDIEVVVKNPEKFVEKLSKKLEEAGIEHRVEGSPEEPKVYFKVGEEWVKGIEIFKNDKSGSLLDYLRYGKRTSIAYGFKRQNPIKIEGIESLKLSEQAARKLEGGHVFKEGKIQPKHEGRFKDIGDLAEIGTAYAMEKGLPIERAVIEYAKLAKKLYGEKVDSPIVDFIAERGRLPKLEELAKLGVDEAKVRELLFARESAIENISRNLYYLARETSSGIIYASLGLGSISSLRLRRMRSYSAFTRSKVAYRRFSQIKRSYSELYNYDVGGYGDSGLYSGGRSRSGGAPPSRGPPSGAPPSRGGSPPWEPPPPGPGPSSGSPVDYSYHPYYPPPGPGYPGYPSNPPSGTPSSKPRKIGGLPKVERRSRKPSERFRFWLYVNPVATPWQLLGINPKRGGKSGRKLKKKKSRRR